MFSAHERQKIETLLSKLANGESIDLKQMVYLHNLANQDQAVDASLKRAKREQINNHNHDHIYNLLNVLDLGSPDPQSVFNPNKEDLGEWLSGAPSWITRS